MSLRRHHMEGAAVGAPSEERGDDQADVEAHMRVSEDRYMRDLRRIHLAQRMIRHEVRTTTICAWTGFNERRIRNLAKSYESTLLPANRHRGPSPKRVEVFLRYNIMRSEAACLGGLARSFGVLPVSGAANTREKRRFENRETSVMHWEGRGGFQAAVSFFSRARKLRPSMSTVSE